MDDGQEQVRLPALRRGATVGKTVNPAQTQIRLDDETLWRIAREVERVSISEGIADRKRKVLKLIVSLLMRETKLEFSSLIADNRFLKTRADIFALAFPAAQFRAEMFAAYEAEKDFVKILWIADGKPKPPWLNERLISEFHNAIKRAVDFEYTDDELRELFEIALHQSDR